MLTVFPARVRSRAYGQGGQSCVQSITDALTEISKTCQLVGEQSPIYQIEGGYILTIKIII